MKKTVTTLVLLAGFSGAALAAPAFEEVDADKDGLVSQSEAAMVEGLDFATADGNGDGWIDRGEYETATAE
jgi:hypothetical protein